MKINFILIGSGWRAEFYMRLVLKLPEYFQILAVITKNKAHQKKYTEWGFNCVESVVEGLEFGIPEFVVVCIAQSAAAEVSLDLMQKGYAVLSETPVGTNLEDLRNLSIRIPKDAKYQVAEQYHLRPDISSKLSIIERGLIGDPQVATVSLTNNYHAISLIRKFLNISFFEHAVIQAHRFPVLGQPGFERTGVSDSEKIQNYFQTIAIFSFDNSKIGIYNFEDNQHRSFIRSQQVQVKGHRGEVNNNTIKYLKDYQTPIVSEVTRINKGEYENMEGSGIKGFLFEGTWIYKSEWNGLLSDDEIALADVLVRMSRYCQGGESFYSFEEAASDFYLTLLIEEAILNGTSVTTESQPWMMHSS